MKTILAICCFLVLSASAFGQGNLQFSQVVNYTINTPFATGSSRPWETLTITVPAGKVIKIESAHISYQAASSSYFALGNNANPTGHLVLNGGIIASFDPSTIFQQGPIWLAPGTHTMVLHGYFNSSSSYRWNAFVTGIEFNVVP